MYHNRGYPGNGWLCSLHSLSLYKNVAHVLDILIRSLQKPSHCDFKGLNEGCRPGAAARMQQHQPALSVARRGRTPPSERIFLARLHVSSCQSYWRWQACLEGLLQQQEITIPALS